MTYTNTLSLKLIQSQTSRRGLSTLSPRSLAVGMFRNSGRLCLQLNLPGDKAMITAAFIASGFTGMKMNNSLSLINCFPRPYSNL